MSMTRVGAVILNYRNAGGTAEVIASVCAQSRPPDQLLVVDNSNDDDEYARLDAAVAGRAVVLRNEGNLGYAAAMNRALAHPTLTDCPLVILLTHDVLLKTDAVELLVGRLDEAPRTAVVGPLLAYRSSPDRVFSAGGTLGRRFETGHHVFPEAAHEWLPVSPQEVPWVDGAVMGVRRAAVEDLGGFDERFFLYFEEVDLQHRLQAAGWVIEVVPAAQAWQEPGRFTRYLEVRNRYLLLQLHGRTRQRIHYVAETVLTAARELVLNRMAARAYWSLRGLADGARGRYGPGPRSSR
jgi:N-acetylglucosaminyl-diphospho-decaprenol L-rhamnosyltransferase